MAAAVVGSVRGRPPPGSGNLSQRCSPGVASVLSVHGTQQWYRKLFPLGVATSDYLDGIFAPDCRDQDIVHALECLTGGNDWDSLDVAQLRPGSRLAHALQRWRPGSVLPGCGERVSHLDAVTLANLPSKIRCNVNNARNRAARRGRLDLTLASADDWPEAFDALERLHTARWKMNGKPGVLADSRVRTWHRNAIPQLLVQDVARLYSLRLNGEIIAALYMLADPPGRTGRTLYSYLTAFSPDEADLCPGSVLLALVTDQAAERGFTTVDMLRGNESYKDLWHPRWIAIDAFRAERGTVVRELVA